MTMNVSKILLPFGTASTSMLILNVIMYCIVIFLVVFLPVYFLVINSSSNSGNYGNNGGNDVSTQGQPINEKKIDNIFLPSDLLTTRAQTIEEQRRIEIYKSLGGK